MSKPVDPIDRNDTRRYYEREAELGLRSSVAGRRVELRTEYLDALASEGRRSVIDFGSGPGLDGRAFLEAGLRFIGIDLAIGNARLGRDVGVVLIPGSIDRPPVRPGSFSAGWSMSTLMHLPADDAAIAADAMARCLEPGSPLLVALWGADHAGLDIDDSTIEGRRRPYHLRSADVNRELVSRAGHIERFSTWEVGPDGWEYQIFWIRTVT